MKNIPRRILVTGATGFLGKNLMVRLAEIADVTAIPYGRSNDTSQLRKLMPEIDAIVHLAAENRPTNFSGFAETNVGLTSLICNIIRSEYEATKRHIPIIFTSSIQALQNNPYGSSKVGAENCLKLLADATGNPCIVLRLPGTFGKWSKPNYNSVVATFCYNISRGLPIQITDREKILRLVYVDDVIDAFLKILSNPNQGFYFNSIAPEYSTTLGELGDLINSFKNCRSTLVAERVGVGLTRALYATYISFLPSDSFVYPLKKHTDHRGVFIEVLKTLDTGQFSYFTAYPGTTRGGHYHHTKTEKFLVVKGTALFRFRNITTNELYELTTSGDYPQVVDTIPGWSHDITNIGDDEIIVMLWANEIFDRDRPDTVMSKI